MISCNTCTFYPDGGKIHTCKMTVFVKVLIMCCIAVVICQNLDEGDGAGDYAIVNSKQPQLHYHIVNRRSLDDILTRDENSRSARVKRGGHGIVGPVYTYVKTDHHGHFKWGVKHYVGKKYAGHKHHKYH